MKYLTTPKNTANTKLSNLVHAAEIASLPTASAVFLHAGVGGGKSYFCKNVLYQLAAINHSKILYIINRKNPHDQFQKEISNADKDNLIHITTYQSLQKRLSYNSNVFNSYCYIVFDEYHRFIADSIVDEDTDILLPYIYESTAVKFFLSATPYGMDKYLKKEFLRLGNYYITYTLPSDFSMIQIHTYRGINKVHQILQSAIKTDEKVLMFSFNIKELYELSQQYSDSLFICSDSNQDYAECINRNLKAKMIETETLPRRFLFATTCMDIGFNLNDTNIKHIICNLDDIDQIIQCIGRRRIKDVNEKIHVYVKDIPAREMSKKISNWEKMIERAEYMIEEGMESYFRKFGSDRFLSLKDNLLYLKWDGNALRLDAAEMMYLYYKHRISVYEKILSTGISYKNYLSQYVFNSGTQKKVRSKNARNVRSKNNLDVLRNFTGKCLYRDDRATLIQQLNIRDEDRNLIRRADRINKILQEFGSSYKIDVRRDSNRIIYWSVIDSTFA